MELDELKEKWAEYDRTLESSIRLNHRLLTDTKLNRTRSSLTWVSVYLGLEAVAWLAAIVVLGNFIYEHISLARFAVPAVVLDLYSIAMFSSLIRQIALARRINYSEPIAAIQKQIEALRVLHIRTIQWGVLAGLVGWVPFVIVVFKAVFRVDVYEGAWVWSNVAFGLALIPIAIWVSRKFGDRMDRSPAIQAFMRSLAGYNLNAAAEFLAELSRFERETS